MLSMKGIDNLCPENDAIRILIRQEFYFQGSFRLDQAKVNIFV